MKNRAEFATGAQQRQAFEWINEYLSRLRDLHTTRWECLNCIFLPKYSYGRKLAVIGNQHWWSVLWYWSSAGAACTAWCGAPWWCKLNEQAFIVCMGASVSVSASQRIFHSKKIDAWSVSTWMVLAYSQCFFFKQKQGARYALNKAVAWGHVSVTTWWSLRREEES